MTIRQARKITHCSMDYIAGVTGITRPRNRPVYAEHTLMRAYWTYLRYLKRRWRLLGHLVIALTLASCGGDPDTQRAQSQCETFIDVACSRILQCYQTTQAACTSQADSVLQCSRIIAVTSNYDRCVSDSATFSCASYMSNPGQLTLPPSCTGVFRY